MMVFHLLLYLLLYFSVVLVICITGHLLMGALLLIAVAAYGPVLSVTLQFYEYAFYYTSSAGVYGFIKGLREMASPVLLAYTLVQPVILKLVNMRLTEQLLSVTAKEAKQSRHLWQARSTV